MNQETGISTPAGRGAAVVEWDGRTPRPAARDRGLRDAIHDALARGRNSLAGRLADAAARLPRISPSLAAAVMRVRLQQSLPEAALAASRRTARMTAELLLLRGLARLDLGQRPAARTELASAAARGELCAGGLQLLAHLDNSEREQPRATSRMDDIHLVAPVADRRLIDGLASQLVRAPDLVNTLVEVQRRSFDPPAAQLLRRALETCLDEIIDPSRTHAAIVELTLLLEGPAPAAAKLEAAIEAHPMSTVLRALRERIVRGRSGSQEQSRGRVQGRQVLATIGGEQQGSARRLGIAA